MNANLKFSKQYLVDELKQLPEITFVSETGEKHKKTLAFKMGKYVVNITINGDKVGILWRYGAVRNGWHCQFSGCEPVELDVRRLKDAKKEAQKIYEQSK